MTEQSRKIAANVAVIAVIALILFAGDTLLRQRAQFATGEAAAAAGDFAGALAGYESAIHMYVPLSPYVGRSAEGLWEIGEHFRGAGDRERALIAYRALRSSFYSARWLVTPGKEWIRKADIRIAELTGGTR